MTQGSGSGGETRVAADMTGGPAPASAMPESAQLAELLKGIDKTHVGAAMSKMISASIGDIAMVFARSPQHKHYTFADMEWMIVPAVLTGQFYVAELQQKETGAKAPVAAVLWASVSAETDQRLSANPAMRIKLRPDEWQAGEHLWIVDVAGEQSLIAAALRDLSITTFKDKAPKVTVGDAQHSRVVSLHDLLAQSKHDAAVSG